MTLGETLARAADYLRRKGVENPRLDAELLLGHALQRSRVELYMEYDLPLTNAEADAYRTLVTRRGNREPLAYVLGEWGFRRLTLKTDARALVPRPETEIVVERCLELLEPLSEPEVLDVGTGSGAIALSIASEHPTAKVTAIDSSLDALALARENLAAIEDASRVRILEHDLRSGFGRNEFDLVVSNPPYVDAGEFDALQPEIREWEPRAAVVGNGETDEIVGGAFDVLRPGGWLVLETADGRAQAVGELLEAAGYGEIRITRDLAERERVVEARRP